MKIQKIKLYYEKEDPYLHIVGSETTPDGEVLSVNIPKLSFPQQFYNGDLTITLSESIEECCAKILTSGKFELLPVRNHENLQIFYTITREEIPKELTIKQIEKELGYPIKIVGEKNENN